MQQREQKCAARASYRHIILVYFTNTVDAVGRSRVRGDATRWYTRDLNNAYHFHFQGTPRSLVRVLA